MATPSVTSILITATDKTKAAFDTAQKNMGGLQSAAGKLNSALAGIGVGLSVGAFAGFAKSSIDAADNLNDLSQKIGVGVEQLAGYKLAAEQSGITLEEFGKAAKQMAKNLAEGDPLLKKLGITASDVDGAMAQLADVFDQMPDGAQKTAIAMQLMGKSGADMIPLLNGGSAALGDMLEQGQKLYPVTAEMAKAADEFNDSMAAFKTKAEGFGISIANSLLPAMNDMLARFRDAADLSSKHGGFVSLVMGGINPSGDNAENLKNVRTEIAGIEKTLKDYTDAQLEGYGHDTGAMRKRLSELRNYKKSLLEIQQREAMAIGAPFADYKQAKEPRKALPADLLKTGGTGKASAQKLDVLDPFGPARRSAEAAAIAETVAAQNAEFDALFELRQYQIDQDERAAAGLGRLRDAHLSLIDPIQQYRDKLDEVQRLMDSGMLSPDQAAEAQMYWQEQIEGAAGFGQQLDATKSKIDSFAEEAAKGFQDSLADFLFDPFDKGLSGMLDGFKNILKRMAAEAIAADITRSIFGSGKSGGGQNIFGSIAGLFGFANGGSFTVGGTGGTDSQVVAFRATPGEEVAIRTPEQMRANSQSAAAVIQHINIDARGADAGVDARIMAAMSRAKNAAVAEINASLARGGATARLAGVA